MPKVSEDYKDARRRQILVAARACFARKGFHETSMQDLFAESGLSSGAVYRYFRSKAEVITAIAEANMDEVISIVRSLSTERAQGLGGALGALIAALQEKAVKDDLGPMAVLVWSEALRDPALAASVRQFLNELNEQLAVLIRTDQKAGRLPADMDADALGRLLTSLVPGSIVQLTLFGEEAMRGVPDALRALWR